MKKFFLFFTLLLFCISSFCAPAAFDVSQANKTLDKLSIKLSTENLHLPHLKEAVTVLTALYQQAQNCAKQQNETIENINQQINKIKLNKNKVTHTTTSDQKYLEEKLNKAVNAQSECRLFALRAKESLDALNSTVQKLTTRRLLTLSSPVWQNLTVSKKLWRQSKAAFDSKIFLLRSGLNNVTRINFSIFLVILIIMVLLTRKLRKSLQQFLIKKQSQSSEPSITKAFCATLRRFIYPLTVFLITAVYTTLINLPYPDWQHLTLMSYCLLSYTVIYIIIRFALLPPSPADSITKLEHKTSRRLVRNLHSLVFWSLFGCIVYIILRQQPLPIDALALLQTFFITIFATLLMHLLWLSYQTRLLFTKHPVMRISGGIIFASGLLFILNAEWFGYHNLVRFILQRLILTLIYSFSAWLIYRIVSAGIDLLTEQQHPWQHRWRNALGLKPHHSIPELILWQAGLTIVTWGTLLILLITTWNNKINLYQIINSLTQNIKIASLNINVLNIILAIVLFPLFTFFVRWLRESLTKRKTQLDESAHSALAIIVGYIGFGLALLLCLLIAGVNFTGLAIIAGALSVGIGFGLQGIVNNFLSGIILLLERPVKPGDRIQIGEVEGFVKKVRIRSTQIQTLMRTDVIVPNSDLVSQQVTNLMFRDNYWRVAITAGVAYGSDTKLVEQLLLEAADAHPNVVREEIYAPNVLFRRFGPNSLEFELWCVIDDVNLKYRIESELNFRVDQLFREHGITIAFPQRDVHIRDWRKTTNE